LWKKNKNNKYLVHNLFLGGKIRILYLIEGSLEVKLPTICTDEKQSREEAEKE
jgi:hypothetical protein